MGFGLLQDGYKLFLIMFPFLCSPAEGRGGSPHMFLAVDVGPEYAGQSKGASCMKDGSSASGVNAIEKLKRQSSTER